MGRDIRDLQSRELRGDGDTDESTVVGLEDETSGDVFSALTSETARSLLAELYRRPATQSELAERVDTSLQNANYHLKRLTEADLVAVVDELYSQKGVEMSVYGPAHESFVLVVSADGDLDAVRQAVDNYMVDTAAAAGD